MGTILLFFHLPLMLVLILASSSSLSLAMCNGSIAECDHSEGVFLMESDVSRRFLEEQKRYISYGALNRDQPVCGGGSRGQPYSSKTSCLPPSSNPQTRGCSKVYRCRQGGSS
ncbi:hypothetical protein QQ045_032938 [Rhodiola kirilowii]